jgi:hypothetical protein
MRVDVFLALYNFIQILNFLIELWDYRLLQTNLRRENVNLERKIIKSIPVLVCSSYCKCRETADFLLWQHFQLGELCLKNTP